jgi:hypothetical protein
VLHHLLFFSFAIMHLSFFSPVFVVGEAIHVCGMNECYMLDAAGFLFFLGVYPKVLERISG